MTRVMIIGGGIGGLALAHGLRDAGVPVTVFERTIERDDWLQGYRIHINPHGSQALHDCLPSSLWQKFLETVSAADAGFAFVTEHMTPLLSLEPGLFNPGTDPARLHYGVSRIALRDILLTGLQDTVQFGKTFTGYSVSPSGSVVAHFADGTTAVGDVLIGADGANSRVRAQLLPHADRVDTGVVAIAGKTPLAVLPPELSTRVNMVIPSGAGSLFSAVWKSRDRTAAHADYTLWGFSDAAQRFPSLDGLDGAGLRDVVLSKMRGWSPVLRDLITQSGLDTINVVRIKSAALIKPWQTGNVTLLGDAIHSMTPMAGIGANTALRDADLLRRQLTAVHGGSVGLIEALSTYEREMFDYGFAAVRTSLRNAKQASSANRFGRAMFRNMLRLTSAVPPLKRQFAKALG